MGLTRREDSITELNEKKQQEKELNEMATESQLGIVELMNMQTEANGRMDEIELGIIELMGKIGGQ